MKTSTTGAPARTTSIKSLKERHGLTDFIGESPVLWAQIQNIPKLAQSDSSVLITGETGTGKEICARLIHSLSKRQGRPFIALNCGAVPTELVENELFGHARGAFTGANEHASGVVREAEGGTLFFDEIDALLLSAQVKLLRLLQEREFHPLGAARTQKADIRVIAAMNKPVEEVLRRGRLREDLLFRLNVLTLNMPPLRQRGRDVMLLAVHFHTKYSAKLDKPCEGFTRGAVHRLSQHDWPGNVRELEHVIERAVTLATGPRLDAADLQMPRVHSKLHAFQKLKAQTIKAFEFKYLDELLKSSRGNITHAAKSARIDVRVLRRMIRQYRMQVRRYTPR